MSFPCHKAIRHIKGLTNPADAFTRGDPSVVDVHAGSPWFSIFAMQLDHLRQGDTRSQAIEGTAAEWSATCSCENSFVYNSSHTPSWQGAVLLSLPLEQTS
jgi:hypothetical protein